MPDYQKTKIYKIWSPNSEKVYVGATVQTLAQRMGKHRKPSNDTQSKLIIDLGDAKIELLEEYPCISKMESDKKEGEYIRKLDCVNKHIIGRTMKEWREDNKEKLAEKRKAYREANLEKVREQERPRYSIRDKEKIAKQKAEYNEKNKL